MRLEFTSEAQDDLLGIALRIAERSPGRALTYVDEIEYHCRRIADFPLAGSPRPKWGDGIRIVIHGNYIAVYRVRDDAVQILRVVHGARNLDQLFDEEQLPE